MNKEVIHAIRGNMDDLRHAKVFQKPEIAENILSGVLSVLTDLENRVRRMEKENG